MTRYFSARPDEGDLQWLTYVDRPGEQRTMETLLLSQSGDGTSWGSEPLVSVARVGDHGAPLARVPMPWLGSYTIAFESDAIDLARPILTPHADLRMLPTADGTPVAVVVPPWVEGALDEMASDIVRFPSSGRIMLFKKLVLNQHAEQFGVLRLAEDSRGSTYFRQDLVDALVATGIVTGTHFHPET